MSTTRDQILAAARGSFARHGFDGTSVRAVAASAAVDPALVRRFFGTKEDLLVAAFTATMSPGDRLQETLARPLENLGEDLVDYFLAVWDEDPNQSVMLGTLRSACTNERAADLLRRFIAGEVLSRLEQILDQHEAQRRAALIASQLVGLAIVRYIVRIEPLASASADELRSLIGPTLQCYLTGALEPPRPLPDGSYARSVGAKRENLDTATGPSDRFTDAVDSGTVADQPEDLCPKDD